MQLSQIAWVLVLVYILIGITANFLAPQRFPKIPGDILIEKPGFRFYIPFISPILITILISYFLGSILKQISF